MDSKEVWKDVIGYEEIYQVSNLGRIKSVDRVAKHKFGTMNLKERILKPGVVKGYFNVILTNSFGALNNCKVHTLVAESFLGPRPKDCIVDHIDNNSKNNFEVNLQYITVRENLTKDKMGTSKYPGVYVTSSGRFRATIKLIDKHSIFLIETREELRASQHYAIALKLSNMYCGDRDKFRKLIKETYENTK